MPKPMFAITNEDRTLFLSVAFRPSVYWTDNKELACFFDTKVGAARFEASVPVDNFLHESDVLNYINDISDLF